MTSSSLIHHSFLSPHCTQPLFSICRHRLHQSWNAHHFCIGLPPASPATPSQVPSYGSSSFPHCLNTHILQGFVLGPLLLHTLSLDKIIHTPEFCNHFYVGAFTIYNFWTEGARISNRRLHVLLTRQAEFVQHQTHFPTPLTSPNRLCLFFHLPLNCCCSQEICPMILLSLGAISPILTVLTCVCMYPCQVYISRCVCSCLLRFPNRCVRETSGAFACSDSISLLVTTV